MMILGHVSSLFIPYLHVHMLLRERGNFTNVFVIAAARISFFLPRSGPYVYI